MAGPKYQRCSYYPDIGRDPVCHAGSDVRGLEPNEYICSDQYSETCPWLREMEREVEEEEYACKRK